MVDQFTKIIRLKIITTVVLLKEIDEIYEDYIWKIYRVPKKILSGKSPQFCHMQVHPSGKLHPRGDATSEPYKPVFYSSHLSRNTSYGGAATLWVFRLPRWRYSYSTQSSMTELLLSVSQH